MESHGPPPPVGLSPDDRAAILSGTLDDPFAVLGPNHRGRPGHLVAFDPHAEALSAVWRDDAGAIRRLELRRVSPAGIFEGEIPPGCPYGLSGRMGDRRWDYEDPYRFDPVLGELDEYLLGEGTHRRLWQALGAHRMRQLGVSGTHFAVWAPNARRVSVVGPFNAWDGRRHAMRRRGSTGVWEIFLPGVEEGEIYKYEILGGDGTLQPLKADPVGFGAESPPGNASVIRDLAGFPWDDAEWLDRRATADPRAEPMLIYEVHLGSWRRGADGRPLTFREAAVELVAYVADLGFTHIELLPITEHPFGGSWGYQPLGLFAPTHRHGPPDGLRDLVQAAHRKGIGVLLDWVPGHFPSDPHGLVQFDGTALYEHEDPREGLHPDWNTLVYNFGRREVCNFLVSNALYWLEEYHLDGLRVDAVASMLYRDYSREPGAWIPNLQGGRENWEAVAFLRRMNASVSGEVPGTVTIAEESTSFPKVSYPVDEDGLGFGFKWNMGWMKDTLDYVGRDPLYRSYHHNQITFGFTYAWSENFILPISHDEVVHGKGSMLGKMPGSTEEAFSNLRAYYGMMWGHPGKKLLFMGQEFAQPGEWDHTGSLDWGVTESLPHAGVRALVRDLNALVRREPALHQRDCEPGGFQWLAPDEREISVFAWIRWGREGARPVVVVCNFTPVQRESWRCGLPRDGVWREALNTDSRFYGGGDRGNFGEVCAASRPHQGQPWSVELTLPPLSVLFLVPHASSAEGTEPQGTP
jgi:1,4-alpha-glucan branching enzyme